MNFCCLSIIDTRTGFLYLIVSNENSVSLGWRRCVLLVEASNSPDSGRVFHHARALEAFCASNGIRLSIANGASGTIKAAPVSALPTPFTSPLFTGSFSSSPLIYSPDIGPQRVGRIDLVPPLNLDGFHSAKSTASPPESPPKRRQLAIPVLSLHEKIQNSPQVGVVHLALQNDTRGSILRYILPHPCFFVLRSCIVACILKFFFHIVGRMMYLWWRNQEN